MKTVRLKTIIVDDEALGRDHLKTLVSGHTNVDVIETCCNGRLALEAIHRLSPDLVFLDMHMPGLSGIEVMELVDLPFAPMFVFATAHEDYAIKAFELQAIDYLLKPISQGRVNAAVDNAVKRYQLLLPPAETDETTNRFGDQVVSIGIKENGFDLTISSDQIGYIESAGDYACVSVGDRVLVKRITLVELEKRLALSGFRRINRSIIINLNFVDRIFSLAGNKYSVVMQCGKKFISNAKRKQALRPFFDIPPAA